MKKFNNTIIIGIDHGYGNMKTANCCFPTGLIAYKGVTVWVQNLLKVDFANLFVINMYLLTAFVTVFRSFANLNFVN